MIRYPISISLQCTTHIPDLHKTLRCNTRPCTVNRRAAIENNKNKWRNTKRKKAANSVCAPCLQESKQRVFTSECALLTCRRGGLERMKSRMTACASFFTLGGISPFTCNRRGQTSAGEGYMHAKHRQKKCLKKKVMERKERLHKK